jgi:tetratricopeptide (TPR) repeat protein
MPRPVPSVAAASFALFLAGTAQAARLDPAGVGGATDGGSAYGAFLAGKAALYLGDTRSAAVLLGQAASAAPDAKVLRERAFGAALVAGDVTGAARLSPGDDASTPALAGLARLTRAVEAMAAGRAGQAEAEVAGDKVRFPHRAAALLLRPWAQAAAGRWTEALAKQDAEGERIVEVFGEFGRAQRLEIRGDYAAADAAYKALATDAATGSLFREPYGEFLERRGRRQDAVAWYDQAVAADPKDAGLPLARARAASGGRPPAAPSVREGAAQSLAYAAAVMIAQRQSEPGVSYLRLALRLDPELDQAWLMVGDAMNQAKDLVAAEEAWGRVRPASANFVDARSRIAYARQAAGDLDGAVALMQETVRLKPADVQAQLALADLLRTGERYPEAARQLDAMVAGAGGGDWRVLYMRAITRDRLGRWQEAETDLKRALELNPNEPELLNYLGYSWIDRGSNLSEGMAMVEKAVAARPNSGAMQDSLGWAHYRLGRYAKAVELLESAIQLEPSDPSINDHLGDAYWMVGRKDEATFQWNRVLTLSPDAALKGAVEGKLKDGLGVRSKVAAP